MALRTVSTALGAVLTRALRLRPPLSAGVLGLAAVCALALAAGATARSAPSKLLGGSGLLRLGDSLSDSSNASRFSLVIITANNAEQAARLRGRSLVYLSGTDVPVDWSDGISYRRASANGWLLKNADGNLIQNTSFDYYIGDVGSSTYRRAFVTNALATLKAHRGLHGVFLDDVEADISSLADQYPAKYPNQSAWATAMAGFVAELGSALRAHGYYLLVNADGYIKGSSGSNTAANDAIWWRRLGRSVSGLMKESYEQLPDESHALRSVGSDWNEGWDSWQKLIPLAQHMGDDFVGVSYGSPGDTRTMVYGKASFLMEWNGGKGAFIFNPSDNSNPWNDEWTTDIGLPAQPKRHVGTGWLRKYTGGIALVNPDPSNAQAFSLGGTYVTADGHAVSEVTVPPVSGLILRSPTPTADKRH